MGGTQGVGPIKGKLMKSREYWKEMQEPEWGRIMCSQYGYEITLGRGG